MGQYYSIYLENATIKGATESEMHDNNFQLCCTIHDWVKNDDLRIAGSCVNCILAAQTFKDVVEAIFGPYPDPDIPEDEHYWDEEDGSWHAIFHGSYGWESIMYEAFKIMAPYLNPGSQLFCYPDEGNWNLTVQQDGSVVEAEEPDQEEHEYFIIVSNEHGNALYDSWANLMLFDTEDDAEIYISDNDLEETHHIESWIGTKEIDS